MHEYLTQNLREEQGICGKHFHQVSFGKTLFRDHRVLAAGGRRDTCTIVSMSGGEILLFEFPLTLLERDGDQSTLSVFYANPQTYTIQPGYDQDGWPIFRLRHLVNPAAIDLKDPAFYDPPPLRHPQPTEQDRNGTALVRCFVLCKHEVPSETWEMLVINFGLANATYRIAVAGKLKHYFAILVMGEAYVLFGIPERVAKPMWPKVVQSEYVLTLSNEQEFFIPDIDRADATR
ncbi:MAG: hypothetical protein HGA16_00615 [Candidatus Moranbacteria bacterium]|nr:hypothetical protein [Candidatus Moranbacteria bacterium]